MRLSELVGAALIGRLLQETAGGGGAAVTRTPTTGLDLAQPGSGARDRAGSVGPAAGRIAEASVRG